MNKWLEILLVLLVTTMPFILLEVGYKEGYRCARRDIEDEKIGMLKCLRCDLYKNRHLYDKKPIAVVTIPQRTEDAGGNPDEDICETCPVKETCLHDGNALCIANAGDYGLYPLPAQENVKHGA